MKIAVFLDFYSMYKEAKKLNLQIDYGQVLHYLSSAHEIHSATAFVPLNAEEPYIFDEALNHLVDQGYKVKTKISTYSPNTQLNVGIDLTTEALKTAYEEKIDGIMIISNNTDYGSLIIHLRSLGYFTHVVTMKDEIEPSYILKADQHTNLLTDIDAFIVPKKEQIRKSYVKIVREFNLN